MTRPVFRPSKHSRRSIRVSSGYGDAYSAGQIAGQVLGLGVQAISASAERKRLEQERELDEKYANARNKSEAKLTSAQAQLEAAKAQLLAARPKLAWPLAAVAVTVVGGVTLFLLKGRK